MSSPSGPSISVSHTADGSNGWNRTSPVALAITVTQGTAALADAPTCTDGASPLSVTGSGSPYAASVAGDGSHAISCTVTDTAGQSASDTDTVKIDTVKPTVTVPADITVDATRPSDAAVSYASSFSDATSGLAKKGCTPASDSTFPIGTTTVTCTATDKAGNSESGTFTVTITITVTNANQAKQAVLASLQAQLAATPNRDTKTRLSDAIGHLQDSLDPHLWVVSADGNHLDPCSGGKVFDEEKAAVTSLVAISHPAPAINASIAWLEEIDRLLAQTAIDDAIAAHADPSEVGAAQHEMANAEGDLADGHFASAIDHRKSAWRTMTPPPPPVA